MKKLIHILILSAFVGQMYGQKPITGTSLNITGPAVITKTLTKVDSIQLENGFWLSKHDLDSAYANQSADTTKTPVLGHIYTQYDGYVEKKRVDDSLANIYTQGQVDAKLATNVNLSDSNAFYLRPWKVQNLYVAKSDSNTTFYKPWKIKNLFVSLSDSNSTFYPVWKIINLLAGKATPASVHDSILFNLTGVLTDKGNWNPVGNLFPSTSVVKGDKYTIITTNAFLGGTDSVWIGSVLIARVNTPGQVSTNWNILNSRTLRVASTPQLFNSSSKGPLFYNGREPLAGALHGGSAAPINNGDTLNVDGHIYVAGRGVFNDRIITSSYVSAGSYLTSSKYSSAYPATVGLNSGLNIYPSSAYSSVRTRFGSLSNSSTVWNTTPTAVSERHTYRQTVDVISGARPVSYLNFGFFKDAGTELITHRIGMTGDFYNILGTYNYSLSSYTGGTVSQPVTNDKATSATSTGYNWYNYTAGDWARIGYLSNTGRLTITGGIRLPQDSLIKIGSDTVAMISDLNSINVNVNGGLIKDDKGVIGLDSANITTGDSVALRDKYIYAGNYNYKTAPYYSIGSSLQLGSSSGTLNYNYRDDGDIYFSSVSQLGGTQNDAFMTYTSNNKSYAIRADTTAVYILQQNQTKKDSFEVLQKYQIQNLINPKYDTLASTATIITYNAAVNPYRSDTIGENHTYKIIGTTNGSKGQLNLTVTSTATITMNTGVLADGQSFTSLAAGVYNICWEKVQGTFNYNIHKYVTYTGW